MTMELREEARRREEEREELARRGAEFAGDVRRVAALPEGRRFLRWLIDQGDIFAEGCNPGVYGAYRAGFRTFSLRLWRILRECLPPDDFVAVALAADGNERVAKTAFEETRHA